ncbi:MAG: hypothetical protein AAFQ58_19285 [Pseudomonadota bacterium]
MTKSIHQGSAVAKITKDATGDFFVVVTRGGQCLPGIRGRYYDTAKKAETGAKRMLKKAA